MSPLSLYIHIPFCHVRCNFCNLHAYGMRDYERLPDLRHEYTAALCREVEAWATRVGRVKLATIFFGGGTPTELSATQLGAVLSSIRQHLDIDTDAEVTVEGYPGLGGDYMVELRAAGVNRVSFGVQSFEPSLLALLDRQHTAAMVAQTVAEAQSLDFLVALDFIYGLPGQTLEMWASTLDQALVLAPDHLSLYALSIEEATRLRALVQRGVLPRPDPDVAAEMYRLAQARLAETGYEQYELSNWAKPGHACRHNQVYWRNEPWLGIGAGAYGWYDGQRLTNVLAPTHYVEKVQTDGLAIGVTEVIPRATEMAETVMLGLRLREGLDVDRFAARFGERLEDIYAAPLAELIGWGLLAFDGRRLRLTETALLVSNEVFARFLL